MTYKKAALQLRKTPRISVEQPFFGPYTFISISVDLQFQ